MIDTLDSLERLNNRLAADVQKKLSGPFADAVREALPSMQAVAWEYARRVMYLQEHGTHMPAVVTTKEANAERPQETLGAMLRNLREKHGEKIIPICKELHKSTNWLSNIEHGRRQFSRIDLLSLLDHFRTDPEPFLAVFDTIDWKSAA